MFELKIKKKLTFNLKMVIDHYGQTSEASYFKNQ